MKRLRLAASLLHQLLPPDDLSAASACFNITMSLLISHQWQPNAQLADLLCSALSLPGFLDAEELVIPKGEGCRLLPVTIEHILPNGDMQADDVRHVNELMPAIVRIAYDAVADQLSCDLRNRHALADACFTAKVLHKASKAPGIQKLMNKANLLDPVVTLLSSLAALCLPAASAVGSRQRNDSNAEADTAANRTCQSACHALYAASLLTEGGSQEQDQLKPVANHIAGGCLYLLQMCLVAAEERLHADADAGWTLAWQPIADTLIDCQPMLLQAALLMDADAVPHTKALVMDAAAAFAKRIASGTPAALLHGSEAIAAAAVAVAAVAPALLGLPTECARPGSAVMWSATVAGHADLCSHMIMVCGALLSNRAVALAKVTDLRAHGRRCTTVASAAAWSASALASGLASRLDATLTAQETICSGPQVSAGSQLHAAVPLLTSLDGYLCMMQSFGKTGLYERLAVDILEFLPRAAQLVVEVGGAAAALKEPSPELVAAVFQAAGTVPTYFAEGTPSPAHKRAIASSGGSNLVRMASSSSVFVHLGLNRAHDVSNCN